MMNHYSGRFLSHYLTVCRMNPRDTYIRLFLFSLALLQRRGSVKRISKATSTMQPSMLMTIPAFLMRWETNEEGNAQIEDYPVCQYQDKTTTAHTQTQVCKTQFKKKKFLFQQNCSLSSKSTGSSRFTDPSTPSIPEV